MFSGLPDAAPDPIIRLMQQFREDPRDGKIDLGVGVYRDAEGRTPVMAAVKAAEARLVEKQESKGYVGLSGDPEYLEAMRGLLLGSAVEPARLAAVGTPGGTGAIRQLLELTRSAAPGSAIWIPAPSWPNHAAIISALGMELREYRYFDAGSGLLDFEAMRADLGGAQRGDVILLHGCCHNPCGADLQPEHWAELGEMFDRQGLIPFVDIAYQGFGDGIDMDAAGMRHLAARLPEMLISASCSKNFGLYRDRAGVAMVLGKDADDAGRVSATLASLNRQNFAFPPDHGARVVSTILDDTRLRAQWQEELSTMRERIAANRVELAAALRAETNSPRFDFLESHRGMFSLLGLAPAQVEALRSEHGVYLIGDSRINLAGLNASNIPTVARALARIPG